METLKGLTISEEIRHNIPQGRIIRKMSRLKEVLAKEHGWSDATKEAFKHTVQLSIEIDAEEAKDYPEWFEELFDAQQERRQLHQILLGRLSIGAPNTPIAELAAIDGMGRSPLLPQTLVSHFLELVRNSNTPTKQSTIDKEPAC